MNKKLCLIVDCYGQYSILNLNLILIHSNITDNDAIITNTSNSNTVNECKFAIILSML